MKEYYIKKESVGCCAFFLNGRFTKKFFIGMRDKAHTEIGKRKKERGENGHKETLGSMGK